ncbi:hypothetical protein CL673_08400 [Candidatus Bathyarchaeota archaeon]|nr:hypothetical protein [Candidatus Bathyarchaeota archaeon]
MKFSTPIMAQVFHKALSKVAADPIPLSKPDVVDTADLELVTKYSPIFALLKWFMARLFFR